MKRKLYILLSLCMISSSIYPTIPVSANEVSVQDNSEVNNVKTINAGAADAIHARNITVQNSQGETVVIDGSGTAIGILDNGIANHPALRKEPKNPKIKGKGKIILAPLAGVKFKPNFPYSSGNSTNPDNDPFYPYLQADGKYKNTNEDNPKYNIHGLHVAGIAAANGPIDDNSNIIIQGIAPEAQIVFAKAAETGYSTMLEDNFLAQDIRNMANAGADVINMSLGTDSSTNSGSNTLHDAIDEVVSNGVVVVSTVGNMGYMGESYHKPLAKNPDYGVIARPGLFNNVVGTVVFDSPYRFDQSLAINDKKIKFKNAFYEDKAVLPRSFNNKTGEIINMQNVTPDTVASTDVSGKWVLMYRNAISGFKTQSDSSDEEQYLPAAVALKRKGAVGVIVANKGNDAFTPKLYPNKSSDGTYVFDYYDDLDTFPVFSIGEENINEFKNLTNLKLKIIDVKEYANNPDGMMPMDWSSWAVSSDRVFGIDMGTPAGYAVTSLGNGYKWNYSKDLYEPTWGTFDMAGTSMAAPQISGAVALVKQGLIVKHPELVKKSSETVNLIRNLLMSTSDPQETLNISGEKTYWSPRKQGNGIIQVKEAVNTEVIAISPKSADTESGYAKTNLRDIKDNKVEFTIKLVNYGSKARTYRPNVTVMADEVDNEGYYTLKSKNIIMPYNMDDVIVPAAKGGTPGIKEVIVSSNIPQEVINSLKEKSPNGFHVDGYVRFYDITDDNNKVNLVHSFTGFIGDWAKAPTLEKYIYNMQDGEEPFYKDLMVNPKEEFRKGYLNSTHLESNIKTDNGFKPVILGAIEPFNYKTKTSKNHLAISPNGDGNADKINPILVMLRNYRKIDLEIKNISNPSDIATVYKTSYGLGNTDNGKSFFGSDMSLGKVLQSPKYLGWNGLDSEDRVIEGLYEHKMEVYPYIYDATNPLTKKDYDDHENVHEDHIVNIKVDITPPVLESVLKISESNGKVSFKINAKDPNLSQTDVAGSGIKEAVIQSHGKKIKVPFDVENDESLRESIVELDNNMMDNASITLTDWAYNSKTYPLELNEDNDNIGKLSIESVQMSIPETKEEVEQGEQEIGNLTVEYEAVNAASGKVYHNINKLPAGNYHVRAVNLPKGYLSKEENTSLTDNVIIKKGSTTNLKLKYIITPQTYQVSFSAKDSVQTNDYIKENGVNLSLYNPKNNSIYYIKYDANSKNYFTEIPEGVYYCNFTNLDNHNMKIFSPYGQKIHAINIEGGGFFSYKLRLDNEEIDPDYFDELNAEITSTYHEHQSYFIFTGKTGSKIELEVTPMNEITGTSDESAKRTYNAENGDFTIHEMKSPIGDIKSRFQLDLSDNLINSLKPGEIINVVEVSEDGHKINSKNRAVVVMHPILNAQMAYYAVEKALESVPEEQKEAKRAELTEKAKSIVQKLNIVQSNPKALYYPNNASENAETIFRAFNKRKDILNEIWPGGNYPIIHIHNGHFYNIPFYENFHFRGDDNDYQGFLAYNTAAIYDWKSLDGAYRDFTKSGLNKGTDHLPPTDELEAPDLTLSENDVWKIRPMRALYEINDMKSWSGDNINISNIEDNNKTAVLSQSIAESASVKFEAVAKDDIDILKPLSDKIKSVKMILEEKRNEFSDIKVKTIENRLAIAEKFLERPIFIDRIINQEISDLDLVVSQEYQNKLENESEIENSGVNTTPSENEEENSATDVNVEKQSEEEKQSEKEKQPEFVERPVEVKHRNRSRDSKNSSKSVKNELNNIKSEITKPIETIKQEEVIKQGDTTNHRHYHIVAKSSYVKGYPDGTFRPDVNVSRAEFATMFQKMAGLSAKTNNLKDAKNHWAKDSISAMVESQLMVGYSGGDFKPDRKMTRAEIASVIFKAKNLTLKPSDFKDSKHHWADGIIGALEKEGIINGYPDGTFNPDGVVTRAEAVTMLNKAFNIKGEKTNSFSDTKGHWAEKEISIAAI